MLLRCERDKSNREPEWCLIREETRGTKCLGIPLKQIPKIFYSATTTTTTNTATTTTAITTSPTSTITTTITTTTTIHTNLTERTNDAIVIFNILESEVIDDFSLQLEVGRLGESGTFSPIKGDVKIGEKVQVKLQSIATANFR